MKTKEELTVLKEELEAVSKKLCELTEDELAQVTGSGKRVPVPTGSTTILTAVVSHIDDLTGDFTDNYVKSKT